MKVVVGTVGLFNGNVLAIALCVGLISCDASAKIKNLCRPMIELDSVRRVEQGSINICGTSVLGHTVEASIGGQPRLTKELSIKNERVLKRLVHEVKTLGRKTSESCPLVQVKVASGLETTMVCKGRTDRLAERLIGAIRHIYSG